MGSWFKKPSLALLRYITTAIKISPVINWKFKKGKMLFAELAKPKSNAKTYIPTEAKCKNLETSKTNALDHSFEINFKFSE